MKKAKFTLPEKPHWQSDSQPITPLVDDSAFRLLPPGSHDIQTVIQAYQHHAIAGVDIASIETIATTHLEQRFESHATTLSNREGNPKFQPTWANEDHGQRLVFRQQLVKESHDLAMPYANPNYPHVHFLPLWHGTNEMVANHIFKGGYGIFTANTPGIVTDDGFFGKGVYSAHEAEYTFRCYAQQHGDDAVLLLNWVSFYHVYPVIDGDMPKIRGKIGGYAQCDIHYIPIRSNHHPHTDVYYPCKPGDVPQYTELVVFNEAQCLPRYKVKVKKRSIQAPLVIPQEDCHQQGLEQLKAYDYETANAYFEKASQHNNPLSQVRQHWLLSGGSELFPRQSDEMIEAIKQAITQSMPTIQALASPLTHHNSEAQFALAWCYAHGLGIEKNIEEAIKNYTLAALQQHTEAQYQLARCYSIGNHEQRDIKKALFYYEHAAKQGHAAANYVLSQVYTLGLWGLENDEDLAKDYREKAYQGRYPAVMQSKDIPTSDEYYAWGEQQEKSQAHEKAAKAYQIATAQGHTAARTNLGFFFLAGQGGCEKDRRKAHDLWKQSAQEGHPRAMRNLANQLKKGVGVPKDIIAAQHWESEAAKIESTSATMQGGK